jgi:hypothetical protein
MNRIYRLGRGLAVASVATFLVVGATFAHGTALKAASSAGTMIRPATGADDGRRIETRHQVEVNVPAAADDGDQGFVEDHASKDDGQKFDVEADNVDDGDQGNVEDQVDNNDDGNKDDVEDQADNTDDGDKGDVQDEADNHDDGQQGD